MLGKTKITRLKNGVSVVTSAIENAESIAMGIWIGVGGRHERRPLAGVSHFLEHMLFKGTPTRSALAVSQAIEGRGGYLNAFTQEEATCYYARLPYEYLPQAFDVLSDMYLHAAIREEDFRRERDVILEEIKMYQDLPQHVVQENLLEAMFRDHALGAPLSGNPKSLGAMSRETLLRYKARAYTPGSTVFAFAGRLDHEACVARVERAVGGQPRRRGLDFMRVDGRVPQRRLSLTRKEIAQTHAVIGFRIFGRHDDRRYALRVLNGVLGENMSSRLFQSVRERRGLCYSINSGFQLFEETGLFTVSGGFDARRTIAALKRTAQEMRRLIDAPVGARELRRVKEYLQGTFRLGLEGVGNQMMFIGESLLNYGRVVCPEETLAGIAAVTADDVQRVAEEVFEPSRLTLSLVVPNAQAESEDEWMSSLGALFA
ncbi:MAG TPA: pitrilysin family protein [Kiritimatiellia bacterium]|nr:pitrilysin family protein [Kiritimatiellia bacterium]HOR97662.1 pitrilysin family protein [Kiritimatiellia bacterium]HPC48714.1 pitrilysin family protein [Kiritimatiellia bacterium]HPK37220.1 pitrilysin family protein [Kiritimatiellia bacterium]HPW75288.1 pitrilysin family protein [Kiritimatiellia bacterium]